MAAKSKGATGAKGAKGSSKPVELSKTAAKDLVKLEELHSASKGKWTKKDWAAYAKLQKKVADQKAAEEAPKPTVPEEKPSALAEGADAGEKQKVVRKLEPPRCKFDGSGDYELFRLPTPGWIDSAVSSLAM